MTHPRTPIPSYVADEIVDTIPAAMPAMPAMPDTPDTPDTPAMPDTPETPDTPDPNAMPNTALDDIVDDIVDLTPVYAPEGEFDLPIDMTPTSSPEGDTPDTFVWTTAARMLDRRPTEQRAAPRRRTPLHTPLHRGETRDDKRLQPVGRRWKRVVPALVGIALLLFAGTTVLGHAPGLGTINLTGGSTRGAHATATPAVNTPTLKPLQIGNTQLSTAIGPLILLNPGIARQGTQVTVTGSGFDPGAVVDLMIRHQGSTASLVSTFVQTDKGGTFSGAALSLPLSLNSGTFVVVASERNSKLTAQAVGEAAGGAPQVKLARQVGQPGDTVVLALQDFAPGETINVYWNTLSGQPITTFQADGGGNVGQGKLQVPVGAVGANIFLFVGQKSQSVVAATFQVLQLYPTVKLSSYALQADNLLSFSGSGFGPGESVAVFLNNTNGQPLEVVPTDSSGSFTNIPGFVVPFQLKGKQTLIFVGEQSRAPNAVSFAVEPYAPSVEPSTYGGFPGTTITFFVSGFARNEVVHVFAGHTNSSMGTMVSCFQADSRGAAAAVGSYLIPGNAQGTLGFALVGAKSGGVGVASVNVTAPPAPVQTPPQQPFTCPLDQQHP